LTLIAKVGAKFFIIKGNKMINATVDNKVLLAATFADAFGNPAVSSFALVWSTDNPAVLLEPAGSYMAVNSQGKTGAVKVTVTAGNLTDTATIEFIAGVAVSVSLAEVVSPTIVSPVDSPVVPVDTSVPASPAVPVV
jgi:hypothetical protein